MFVSLCGYLCLSISMQLDKWRMCVSDAPSTGHFLVPSVVKGSEDRIYY